MLYGISVILERHRQTDKHLVHTYMHTIVQYIHTVYQSSSITTVIRLDSEYHITRSKGMSMSLEFVLVSDGEACLVPVSSMS